MLTKEQKTQQVKEGKEMLKNSRVLIFADFSKTGVKDLKKLRDDLRVIGAKMKVFKKRLLRIAFSESGLDFSPERFESQAATIFSDKDISETAAPVYKFSVAAKKTGFNILGGYDLEAKNFLEAETVKQIGKLPSKEVLLGQFVGMLSMPIKMFMNVLEQKSKKVG